MRIKKNLILILLIFLAFLISCALPTENEQENDLFGTWQLKIRSGGFAGINDTIDIAKNNYILLLKTNNEFSYFYNDTLTITGSFKVNREKTIFSQDSLDVITYFNYDLNIEKDVVLYLNDNKLKLSNNAVDSFVKFYTKIK